MNELDLHLTTWVNRGNMSLNEKNKLRNIAHIIILLNPTTSKAEQRII